jgi:glycosyltransferase involved in cell wall biosynthesis
MARTVAHEGLSDYVELLGWVDARALPEILDQVDVAVQPVNDTPIARAKCPARLLDLMAAGIPIVTQSVGEYSRIVDDGTTGLLVPPGGLAAMASALIALLEDAERRNRMAAAAQCRAQEVFGWENLVCQLEEAYGARR